MIIYQLPNGKIVNLSIDAFLRMSDDDLKYMDEKNIGTSASHNSFDLKDKELNEIDYSAEPELLDISTLDSNLFVIEPESPEE